VVIREGSLHVDLATPTCAIPRGGGRPPNREEQEILHLWQKHHLDEVDFSGGDVVAFTRELRSYVR